jgi:MFS family permease
MLRLLERTYISVFRRYPMLLRMALVVLLAEIVFAAVNNYALTFYINEDLGRPMAVVGDIISVFLMAEMFLKFPAGHLSDRYGRRRFTSLGIAVCIGTPLAICVVPPAAFIATPLLLYLVLVPLRVTDGAGSAALWPPLFASVPDHIPVAERGLAMSVMNSAYLAGLALGPALAGVAMKVSAGVGLPEWSGRAPFVMAVVFALGAAAVALTLPAQKTHVEEHEPGNGNEGPRGMLPPLQVIGVVLAITFADMFATSVLAPYLAPYFSQIAGVDRSNVGPLMLVMIVPAAVLGMPIGHLTDRWEKRRVVQISLFVTAAGLWCVPFAHSLLQLAAMGIVVMMGFMFGLPAWLSLITELAPDMGHGKMMGVMAAAQGFGAFLGPYVGGRLWDVQFDRTFLLKLPLVSHAVPLTITNETHAFMFYLAGAMLTLSSLIAFIFIGRRRGKSAPVAEEASISS